MKQRQTFRFYPNQQQRALLSREFGCSRYAYNWALNWWNVAFHEGEKPNYVKCSAAWTVERNSKTWLKESSSIAQQQSIRQLQTAFKNFFDKRASFPNFKKLGSKQSCEYTRNGFKYDPVTRNITVTKLGRLNIRWSKTFNSDPTTITIIKKPSGKYFLTVVVDEEVNTFVKTGEATGIDFGITHLCTLSNGSKLANPRYTYKNQLKLARAQRILSRRVKGSNRYKAQKVKVAKIYEHIANARKDTFDKYSTNIVKQYDYIVIEDLDVVGMVKNHNLAKAISDSSFRQLRTMLEYKAKWYGKELVVIDRFFPSTKMCSNCGHVKTTILLSQREYYCKSCGVNLDRDFNAAKNILVAGRAISGRGGEVKPNNTLVLSGVPLRSVNPSSVSDCV